MVLVAFAALTNKTRNYNIPADLVLEFSKQIDADHHQITTAIVANLSNPSKAFYKSAKQTNGGCKLAYVSEPYKYPDRSYLNLDNAGSHVDAYTIDTGIDVSYSNFGNRARVVSNFMASGGTTVGTEQYPENRESC